MSLSNCEFHENRCWAASLNLAAQHELFYIPPALNTFRTAHTVDTDVTGHVFLHHNRRTDSHNSFRAYSISPIAVHVYHPTALQCR